MNATRLLSAIPARDAQPGDTRVMLLITADTALARQLIRMLSGESNVLRMDEARPYQIPIATTVAQAYSCVGRAAPSAILLDESVAAGGLFAGVLQDFSHFAPIIFLAAPENLARWCAQGDVSSLITQGLVECVPRAGDFAPLAARLLERHARARQDTSLRSPAPAVVATVPDRIQLDPDDAPRDFGEVLRHEVNNPLTGILGNAELLLSRRDRISADMVDRLEVIADLAIRLRETIRRLSNALESRSALIPTLPASSLASALSHRPPT
jgi:signal transduction histidine kinase